GCEQAGKQQRRKEVRAADRHWAPPFPAGAFGVVGGFAGGVVAGFVGTDGLGCVGCAGVGFGGGSGVVAGGGGGATGGEGGCGGANSIRAVVRLDSTKVCCATRRMSALLTASIFWSYAADVSLAHRVDLLELAEHLAPVTE